MTCFRRSGDSTLASEEDRNGTVGADGCYGRFQRNSEVTKVSGPQGRSLTRIGIQRRSLRNMESTRNLLHGLYIHTPIYLSCASAGFAISNSLLVESVMSMIKLGYPDREVQRRYIYIRIRIAIMI